MSADERKGETAFSRLWTIEIARLARYSLSRGLLRCSRCGSTSFTSCRSNRGHKRRPHRAWVRKVAIWKWCAELELENEA